MFEQPVQPLFNNGHGSGNGQFTGNSKKQKSISNSFKEEIDMKQLYSYSVFDELALVISRELRENENNFDQKIKFDGNF